MIKKRQVEPDFLKGLCIVLMVFGHITYIGNMSSQQENLCRFIYTFHIPIFLIISGYLFIFMHDLRQKIIKILRQLAVPYLFFIIIYLIALILAEKAGISTSNHPPKTLSGFFIAILLKPYGAYWFLHSLLIIQLSTIVASAITPNGENKNTILILLLSIVLFLLLSQLQIVSIRSSMYFFIGLLLGMLTKKQFCIPIVPTFLATVLLLGINPFDSIGIYGGFSPFEASWCLLLFSFLWSFSEKYKTTFAIKFFAWIGRNTLSILVLHAFFIVSMKPLGRLFLYIESTGLLYSFVVTLLTVTLCIISSQLIDKLGLSRFLFGVSKIFKA